MRKLKIVKNSGWVGDWIDKYTPKNTNAFIAERDDPLVKSAIAGLDDGSLEAFLVYLKTSETPVLSFALRSKLVDFLEGSSDDARYRLAIVKHPNHKRIARPKSETVRTKLRFVAMLNAFYEAGGFNSKMRETGIRAAGNAGGFTGADGGGFSRAKQILSADVIKRWKPRAKIAKQNGTKLLEWGGGDACWFGDSETLYPIESFEGGLVDPPERPPHTRGKRKS